MKCPICGEPVTKVITSDNDHRTNIKCESEYYVHFGDKLVKFKHPKHNYYGKG